MFMNFNEKWLFNKKYKLEYVMYLLISWWSLKVINVCIYEIII